jgi:hypothetical protein
MTRLAPEPADRDDRPAQSFPSRCANQEPRNGCFMEKPKVAPGRRLSLIPSVAPIVRGFDDPKLEGGLLQGPPSLGVNRYRAMQASLRRNAEANTAWGQRSVLPQWFERQTSRRPDAVAVRCDAEQWTYAELNARANRQFPPRDHGWLEPGGHAR